MEFGQQMNEAKENAMMAFYQNPGYQLERREKKTFILKVVSDSTINFSERLHEPLIIDRLSDIYLDSFLTFHKNIGSGNTNFATGGINKSAFVLKIDQFNNQGNLAEAEESNGNIFNKIVIPHIIPISGEKHRQIHKSRKLNYICSMNPTTLSSLTGTITDLGGINPIFLDTDMFLAEFVIVARD